MGVSICLPHLNWGCVSGGGSGHALSSVGAAAHQGLRGGRGVAVTPPDPLGWGGLARIEGGK